jgi:hypothetical protein
VETRSALGRNRRLGVKRFRCNGSRDKMRRKLQRKFQAPAADTTKSTAVTVRPCFKERESAKSVWTEVVHLEERVAVRVCFKQP